MMSPITSTATPQITPVKVERAHGRPAKNEGTKMISKRGSVIVSLRSRKADFLSHRLRLAWQVVRAHRTVVSAGLRDPTMGGSAAALYEKIHALFSPRARAGPRLERIEFRDEVSSGPEGG